MPLGKRGWLGIGGVALASAAFHRRRRPADGRRRSGGQGQRPMSRRKRPDAVSEAELGNLIRAMERQVKLDEKRFDFSFPARYSKEEWNLSMSAVLSENGNAIWVMAWLDPCPRTALEVPRTSLLKLLAKNDTMGNGKFFAYIPANNRFVLERVVPNENITTARFREVLQDLGAGVVETYPYWSVANWKQPDRSKGGSNMPQNSSRSAPAQPATAQPAAETQRTSGEQPAAQRIATRISSRFVQEQKRPSSARSGVFLCAVFNAPVKLLRVCPDATLRPSPPLRTARTVPFRQREQCVS